MDNYILLSIVWVLLCLAIGLYINGYRLKGEQHYRVGFAIIGVSYLIGICLLVGVIIVL
ncbi:MAG: hypothetical protein JST67_09605 [Bacteroidetes bacterium]|nr:hypothetical protein [Bacteroidota bacterium]